MVVSTAPLSLAGVSLDERQTRVPTTLTNLPRLIRERILKHVLLSPNIPNFDTSLDAQKYTNLFAISYVNKQFNIESKNVLSKSKEFVIVSTNWEGLSNMLKEFEIPIVTDHHVPRFKFYSMRIHVTNPKDKDSKVMSAMVIMSSQLANIAWVLRTMSFGLKHPKCMHEFGWDEQFPRLSIQIRFADDNRMTKVDQLRLLRLFHRASPVGKVQILKCGDPTLRSILPGYPTKYVPATEANSEEEYDTTKRAWFHELRKIDAKDYLDLVEWMRNLAVKAFAAKNYKLAEDRYMNIISFCTHTSENNTYLFCDKMPEMEDPTDLQALRLGTGLVESLIANGHWKRAGYHIGVVLKDVGKQPRLPKDEVEYARSLRRRVTQHYSKNSKSTKKKGRK